MLAVDTSTLHTSLALVDGAGTLHAESSLAVTRGHSPRLLKMVDEVLEHTGVEMDAVDALVCGLGPGSFTGLRVGLAGFKALAFVHDKPVYGASSLEALAAGVALRGGTICPIVDARKAEVYTAVYEVEAGDLVCRLEETVLSPKRLVEELLFAAPGEAPILFVGSGVGIYRDTLEALLGERAHFAPRNLWWPRAVFHALRQRDVVCEGNSPLLDGLEPRYIRPSEAEIAAQRRENSG